MCGDAHPQNVGRLTSMTILTWIVGIAVALVVIFVLFVRWHNNWLSQQTPTGSWKSSDGSATTMLVFDGGPHEGTYKQVVNSDEQSTREFGHWSTNLSTLNMLIMATDITDHERFGIDSQYRISYVGFDSIRIDGPDRPDVLYTRADDIAIDFGPDDTTAPVNDA